MTRLEPYAADGVAAEHTRHRIVAMTVVFAGGDGEPRPVCDRELSTSIIDQPRSGQLTRGVGHRSAARPQHTCQDIVRDPK